MVEEWQTDILQPLLKTIFQRTFYFYKQLALLSWTAVSKSSKLRQSPVSNLQLHMFEEVKLI